MPILLWRRLRRTFALALILAAGVRLGAIERGRAAADCRTHFADGAAMTVRGAFEAIPGPGGGAPFLLEHGAPGGCRTRVRAVLRGDGNEPRPGDEVLARGRWVRTELAGAPSGTAYGAGYLVLDGMRTLVPAGRAHRSVLGLRGEVQRRLRALLGEQAGVAEALVLARREGLEPEQRDRFARAGVAHLLAISGFHIGVVAGVLFAVAAALGLDRRRAGLLAVLGTWLYVAGIGAPYAAVRAAVILTLALAGRLAGRPVDPAGALGVAACAILLAAPAAIADLGFQLSFAAAAGLVVLRPPIRRLLESASPRLLTDRRAVRHLLDPLAAGLSATAAVAPLTALHFGWISLVGIPLTLLLAPILCMVIPQIFLVVAVSWIWDGAARFLSGGLGLLLSVFTRATEIAAALPGAGIAVSRAWLAAGSAGAAISFLILAWAPPLRRRIRGAIAVAAAAAAVLLAPLATLPGGGELRLYFLDVGQGDAIAIRSPAGRWILVDAGPASDRTNAGARVVVPFLRRQGVARLDALVLTHSDMDHVGGAQAVLDALSVGSIIDAGRAAGKLAYVETLERVDRDRIGWIQARAGRTLHLDDVRLEILHPPPGPLDPARDANDYSVVLRLSYGRFVALFTGDAPEEAEEAVLDRLADPDIAVLKVGHHGSTTSTSAALLRATRPEAAIISVGRNNRYGHPAPRVLARLSSAGAQVYRTDLHGTVSVEAAPDGSFRVRTARRRPEIPAGSGPRRPRSGSRPRRRGIPLSVRWRPTAACGYVARGGRRAGEGGGLGGSPRSPELPGVRRSRRRARTLGSLRRSPEASPLAH